MARETRAGQTPPAQSWEPRQEQDTAPGMRVTGQVPGVQTPGLGAAEVFPINQDFPER